MGADGTQMIQKQREKQGKQSNEKNNLQIVDREAKKEKRRRQEKNSSEREGWKMVVPRFRFGLYTLCMYIYIHTLYMKI